MCCIWLAGRLVDWLLCFSCLLFLCFAWDLGGGCVYLIVFVFNLLFFFGEGGWVGGVGLYLPNLIRNADIWPLTP